MTVRPLRIERSDQPNHRRHPWSQVSLVVVTVVTVVTSPPALVLYAHVAMGGAGRTLDRQQHIGSETRHCREIDWMCSFSLLGRRFSCCLASLESCYNL